MFNVNPASPWEYRWKFSILLATQPLIAWLGFHGLQLDGNWYAPEFSLPTALLAISVGLVGCMLRICGVTTLTAAVMGSKNPETDALVTHGIFSAVRNPLYLGSTLILCAYGMFFSWELAAIFALFHWFRYERIIRFEENMLKQNRREQFAAYSRNVPRWFPRPVSLQTLKPIFSIDGIRANGMFVGIWLGMVASAITGSLVALIPFQVIGGTVMVLHFRRAGRTEGNTDSLESDSQSPAIVAAAATKS